jgi:nitrate/nitrite transporter NarK
LRFFGGYSLGFWAPSFFQNVYPTYSKQYSIINSLLIIVGGVTSSFIGGYIGDKFEYKYPKIKG